MCDKREFVIKRVFDKRVNDKWVVTNKRVCDHCIVLSSYR